MKTQHTTQREREDKTENSIENEANAAGSYRSSARTWKLTKTMTVNGDDKKLKLSHMALNIEIGVLAMISDCCCV